MESKSNVIFGWYDRMNSHGVTEEWLTPIEKIPELKVANKNPNPKITVLVKEGRKA